MDAIATPDDAPFRLGLLNPTIYAMAGQPEGKSAFIDVVGHERPLRRRLLHGGPGFDGATGWGSMRFGEFLRLLPR